MISRRGLCSTGLGFLGAALVACTGARSAPRARLFVAKSLEPAIAGLQKSGEPLAGTQMIAAGSQSIARQIQATRRGDVVICADEKWLDWLIEKGLAVAATKRALVQNQLVLIAHRDSDFALDDVTELPALRFRSLILGDPASVPVGRYAETALRSAGVLAALRPRIETAVSTQAALNPLIARRDLLAIVYSTDAAQESRVRVLYRFPAGRPRIEYFAASLATANSPTRARDILELLTAPRAQAAFSRAGFLPIFGDSDGAA